MGMDTMSSKAGSFKSLLMRAWRERWSDIQWGINIKTVLPRGVSGDVYNLSDYILEVALNGPGPNLLILSYLQHSVSSHLVSYGATLESISKFEEYKKPYCVISLLNLLGNCMPRISCKGKPEDCLTLCTDLMKVTRWLLRHVNNALDRSNEGLNYQTIVQNALPILNHITQNEFLYYCLYVGAIDDKDCCQDIVKECQKMEGLLVNSKYKQVYEIHLRKLTNMSVPYPKLEVENPEPLAHILQPMLMFEALLNPTGDIQMLVKQLLTIQQLKGWSIPDLFCECLRVCLMGLTDSGGKPEELRWAAITFLKIPLVMQHIVAKHKDKATVNSGINKVLDHLPLLDVGDTKCGCNLIECLLNELYSKTGLITEAQGKELLNRRQVETQKVSGVEVGGQTAGNASLILRAEPTLNSILKTLSDCIDSNKNPEALLGVLCHVVTGKSFTLILTAAAATGKLQDFAAKLIKLNSAARQGMCEGSSSGRIQTMLFDISFLILMYEVVTYGQDVVLGDEGDSFFEKWLFDNMSRNGRPRPPDNALLKCDHKRAELLLSHLDSSDGDLNDFYMRWDEICLVVPQVLYDILVAWEADSIQFTDVQRMINKLKKRVCCVSVCAAVWLCSQIRILGEESRSKPTMLIQELMNPISNSDDLHSQEYYKERSSLMCMIINKLQSNEEDLCNNKSLKEVFSSAWEGVVAQGWLDGRTAITLDTLFRMGGAQWFVSSLVKVALSCEYRAELFRMVDLVISIFHIDIIQCTLVLLHHTIPTYLLQQTNLEEQIDPQSFSLAYLTVSCCYSALLFRRGANKRQWDPDVEEIVDPVEGAPPCKVRLMTPWADGEDSTIWSLELDSGRSSPIMSPPSCPSSDPLIKAVMGLWKLFLYCLMDGHVSTKAQFIAHFVNLSVGCGKDLSKMLLQFMPPALISYLIKILGDEVSLSTIVHLYDAQSTTGRKAIARMLCLKRNIELDTS